MGGCSESGPASPRSVGDVPGLAASAGTGTAGTLLPQSPGPSAGMAGIPAGGALAGNGVLAGSGAPDAGAMAGAPPPPPLDAGVGRIDAGVVPPPDAAVPPPIDAGTDSGARDAGMSVSGIPAAELEMLRQLCLDEINMYRATLSLAPLDRASPEQELCSDRGAQKDADSGSAHSSSGTGNPCSTGGFRAFPFFQAQNTCPGWPARGASGIAGALQGCLASMWDEGEPPGGADQCIQQYLAGNTACFLAHGHYLNMKGSSSGVSCGFYQMSNGSYWMNQDFF